MLILASASPRRHELLLAAGIQHAVQAANIPEVRLPGELPENFVQRLAHEKAHALECKAGDIILGADTVVVLGDRILGKPRDRDHAVSMLKHLSGQEHCVLTGICLRTGVKSLTDVAKTSVRFNKISEREIEEYVDSGEPLDKAGAYGIQGLAAKFVSAIQGSYSNVVGLPVSLVYEYLKEL